MGFSAIDYAVLLIYLAGITIFGVMFRRSQRTVKDYFIGAKNTHWIIISLSIVATETSTITLIGVPAYFRGELLTAYELLRRRFGSETKNFAASLFLGMRAMGEGIRIFSASLVLSAVIGASMPQLPHLWLWSIIIVGLLTMVYTFEGGIAAVIWTDLVQLVIYICGSLLAAYMLVQLVPGGWPA